ncbi:hypothetical protein MSAN_02414400 [Mycena sanguinolenta]|uniref:Uncharacterized protein n=1 Tax=Mycena sanguinolenta TaxID=230812 RepID=A0A8H6X3H0_9AGAR|nr:hypothetical protein MSAN_02414400 [Mycena sanguinolenta]
MGTNSNTTNSSSSRPSPSQPNSRPGSTSWRSWSPRFRLLVTPLSASSTASRASPSPARCGIASLVIPSFISLVTPPYTAFYLFSWLCFATSTNTPRYTTPSLTSSRRKYDIPAHPRCRHSPASSSPRGIISFGFDGVQLVCDFTLLAYRSTTRHFGADIGRENLCGVEGPLHTTPLVGSCVCFPVVGPWGSAATVFPQLADQVRAPGGRTPGALSVPVSSYLRLIVPEWGFLVPVSSRTLALLLRSFLGLDDCSSPRAPGLLVFRRERGRKQDGYVDASRKRSITAVSIRWS